MRQTILLGFVLAACGDDGNSCGAITIDADNASCGDQLRYFGEYVDWDNDSTFCGINMAVLEVEGGGGMDSTAPNGRFDLCLPAASATTRLVVTQPTVASQCTSPMASYSVPTMFFANHAYLRAGGFPSGRAFTTARQDSFFQSIGVTFDPTKAQVFVHVDGTPHPVAIAAAHAAVQAIVGTTWAAGDTGHNVFFPNVDVGSGTTMLSVAGACAIGAGEIPLVAGTIMNVAVKVP